LARSSEVFVVPFAITVAALLLPAGRLLSQPVPDGGGPVYQRQASFDGPGSVGPGPGNANPGMRPSGPGPNTGGQGPNFGGPGSNFGGGGGYRNGNFPNQNQISGSYFTRPYPYHLDYYKMRYGGSYAPYYGNLYGPSYSYYPPQYNGDYGSGNGGPNAGSGAQNNSPSGYPPYASSSDGHWAWCWVPGQSDAPAGATGAVEYPASTSPEGAVLPEGAADRSGGPAITAPANSATANNATTISPSSAPKH
jgi:hypothetical protein